METSTSLNLVCCVTLLPADFGPSGSMELAVCNGRVGDICRDTFALIRGDVCAACAMVCIAIHGSVRCCDMMPCSNDDGILGDIVPVGGDLHGCCCNRCRPWDGKKGLSAPLPVGGMKKCCAGSDAPRAERNLLCAGVVQLSMSLDCWRCGATSICAVFCGGAMTAAGVPSWQDCSDSCTASFAILGVNRPSLSGLAAAELDEHPCAGCVIGGEGVLKPPESDQPSVPPGSCL